MWVAATFATIALMGAAFTICFLVALLREGMASTCCWIVPKCCELESYEIERKPNHCDDEFVENEDHAEECVSGLFALDSRLISHNVGWRSIQRRGLQSNSAGIFYQRRF